MISASPHQYRAQAAAKGVPPEIAERALTQARPPEMQGLPAILTLRHLAHLTGADYSYLREIVTRTREGYRPFVIRKRAGGGRLIAAPEPTLAAVQRWISREVLSRRNAHNVSMAYSPRSSPSRCAARHLGARWLIKVDIHDFFESISERSVYFVFRQCGYQALVAFELARLCTRLTTGRYAERPAWQAMRSRSGSIPAYSSRVMGHLPQGAPTSPMLSNLISVAMDERLQAVADKFGLVVTRYSDDVVFSTGEEFDRRRAHAVVENVRRVFSAFGFRLHNKKITIAPPGARKIVLGLLVDGPRLRLPQELRQRLTDHVRGVEKFGLPHHAAQRHFASIWGFVRHLEGLLVYAVSIDRAFAEPLSVRLQTAMNIQGWDFSSEM